MVVYLECLVIEAILDLDFVVQVQVFVRHCVDMPWGREGGESPTDMTWFSRIAAGAKHLRACIRTLVVPSIHPLPSFDSSLAVDSPEPRLSPPSDHVEHCRASTPLDPSPHCALTLHIDHAIAIPSPPHTHHGRCRVGDSQARGAVKAP